MKKITFLLLTILYCVVGYSQFPQNFEDPSVTVPNGFPTGWLVTDNGVGTTTSWTITNNSVAVINGTKAAFINRQEIGQGNTSQDWLISPSTLIPTNGQLRFFTKQTLPGDQGTLYQIRIYSGAVQNALTSYTILKQWTEPELNAVFNAAEEKVVDFAATSFGTNTYIAFVRVFTQPTTSQDGDRWIVDDINVVQKCLPPSNLDVNNIAATSVNLFWTASVGSTGYQLEILPAASQATGIATNSSLTNNFLATGLLQNTNYKYYVRSNCGNGNFSEWFGPFNVQTLAIGTACTDPIVIPSLPYQTFDNTGNYGNTLVGPQTSACLPGGVNYQSGNDVFYSFTATENCPVSFTLAPTQARSSMFIYSSCTTLTGNCLAAAGNTSNAPRIINFNVVAGTTYIIVISSNSGSPTVAYNLLIQCEACTSKPTNATVSNPTLTGADFAWTAPTGTVLGYEVAVQPQGSTVPSGAGNYSGLPPTPSFSPNNLVSGTLYQYWVRSECSPGVFSAWVGPILFNTQICAPADQCTYIFRMTDSANNGWTGARMQIRQNDIVIATIGSTYNSGAGPVDVSVLVCDGVPFDIFWSVAGTQPQQCIVSVINSFGQTIATVAGTTVSVGTEIYNGSINCTTPVCTIPPTNLTVNAITTTSGTVNWAAPGLAGALFDIYIVPALQPAPLPGTVPTYVGVPGFSYLMPGLISDTQYDVYVRVQCNAPTNSLWSVKSTFKTLPTCPKPTNQTVAGITTTSAVLGWTEAGSAAQWEVLLLASGPQGQAPAAPGVTPTVVPGVDFLIPVTGATTTTPTTLAPGKIYYYYVRAVCQPGPDPSTWTGPFIFNTVTCNDADKCTYKFILTNTTNNTWNFGRVEVRQNGIVVGTLGTGGINNPIGISVSICDNIPFDLFWSVAGNLPQGMGLTVVNAFNDVVYTKLPGQGTPLTVLYADFTLGNCAPPTCPKPTNLLVDTVGSTTANVSWTEIGSAIQWEVYVVLQGGTPPDNSDPLNGGAFPYFTVNTNPNTQITGLATGVQYQYYVRAICSPTDFSNWTLLNPASFTTKPINDECSASIPVPVNPTQVCGQTVAGNTLGGTASAEISTCPGTENDDVWFNFVATNNIHIVDLLNIAGSTTSVRFAVYAGGDCTTTTQIFCSATSNNTAVLTNLTVGTTYKIRVYTNGSNPNQSATFNVCVSTPPAQGPNDECINAIPVTVNILSECAYVTPGNLIGATGSTGVSNACTGVEDDDVWFSFVATSGNNIVSFLNVEGTTSNLNHAVYSGTCGALVQLYCSVPNSLTTTNLNYVVGQTYYIRVWSNGSTSEVVTFNLCVRPISSCSNASPFCGGAVPSIFPNTSNIAGSSIGQVACLFTTPNPVYYTLHVGQTGPINFTMVQNTQFNAAGAPVGANLDVDFVAWGPFTSTDSCDQIVFGPCPGGCPNNTTNPNFYPLGNIVDCSYSGSFTETISIPNAQAGQFYVILITNFNGAPGFISLVQTNASAPNAGATICCDVDLGPDISICANSVTLNALEGVQDLNNVPVIFEWYLNGVLIPNETGSTLTVSTSGTYKVKGNCGLNPVEDSILVTLSPAINVVSPADYIVCDSAPIDGFAEFDLNTLTAGVLGTLDPLTNIVSYYILESEAISGASTAIVLTTPFINTVANNQTIYIRVQNSNAGLICSAVVPVNLVVTTASNAQFSYVSASFCTNETPNPLPIYVGSAAAGAFTATPAGLIINGSTGEIDLATSAAGSYAITNAVVDTGLCGNVSFTFDVVINEPVNANFTYSQTEYCIGDIVSDTPIVTGTATLGTFTVEPAGLIIDPATGDIDISTSTAGTYVISNTVASVNACPADVQTFTVTLFQAAAAIILYNGPFCTSSISLGPVTVTGTTGGTFSSTSGLTIDAATGTINPSTSTPGTYTVSYAVSDSGPCGDKVFTRDVEINLPPNASFIYDSTAYCIGDVTTVSPIVTGTALLGTFTVDQAGLIIDPATGDIDTVASTAGTYVISNTVASVNACPADVQTFTVTLFQAAAAIILYNGPFCTSSISLGPVTVTGTSGGTFSSTSGLTIDAATGTINPSTSTPGTYTVSYTVADSGPCGDLDFTVDVVISAPVNATFTYPQTAYCIGGVSTVAPLLTGNATLGIFTVAPAGLSINPSTGVIDISSSTAGTYVITNIVAPANACPSDVKSFTVTLVQPANATITYNDPFCASSSTAEVVTIIGATGGTFSSTTGLTIDVNSGTINPRASNAGTYTVTYTVNNANVCGLFTTTTQVTISSEIEIEFTQGCQNNLYRLVAEPFNSSFDVATSTFVWTGPNVITTDEPNVIVLGANGDYTVTVTNAEGCSAVKPMTVNNTSCRIQRGISPNNDGKNDSFDLSALNVKELAIYNRYGTEVYNLPNYTNQWGGLSTGGEELPDGTYFYIIQTLEGENISGWIFINR